jgi:hypothetical protein
MILSVSLSACRPSIATSPLLTFAILAGLLAGAGEQAWCEGFNPQRKFPDTTDSIRVFVDQLPGGLTRAQLYFAASEYVGTQKLLREQADVLRARNPKLIVLHYRLAVRQADPSIIHIHFNKWTNDWVEVNRHDDWFIYTHEQPPRRVYQVVLREVREYVMDISGRINGNTTAGWKEYWAKTVIAEARACGADGVFADSCHPPYAVPAELGNSPLGKPPYLGYIEHLETFMDYAYQQLSEADVYFIPNVGHLANTWDTTQGYYEDVHGFMVEGFGFRGNTADWKLQQNRILKALSNGKIFIAQRRVDADRPDQRLWYLSTFLLLKHNRSYINMFARAPGLDGQLHWWPEYDLNLGPPARPGVPKDVDQLRHGSGIYFRQYQRGLVLVNPTDEERSVRTAGNVPYYQVEPWGGGIIDRAGQMPRGGLKIAPAPKEITLGPWSGAILLTTPKNVGR